MPDRYPRPQLRRTEWLSLNGPWRFRFDNEMRFRLPRHIDEWPLTIRVPFAPETKLSGIEDTGFHRCVWYEREFEYAAVAAGQVGAKQRVILHFGAVDYHAQVWVNDQPVVEHEGGHTPFCADITHVLNSNGKQKVTVRVEDDPHDLEKPRGKQDWRLDPHSIWYPRTTGIWQTVWLERVPDAYVTRIHWTPNLERWEISIHAFVGGTDIKDLRMSVKLTVGDQILAHDTYQVVSHEVHRRIALSDPGIDDYRNELLWSPDRPTLIDAEVQLLRGEEVIDQIKSYTAIRSISTQRERLMLNGRPFNMRLVLDQGYWADSLMTAPTDDALRLDVELAKAMGFNGVRKHQKIEDPRYLYWADKLGLLVWEEMPSAYRFTSRAIRRMVKEWTEAIERDASHPCIVMWVPFNESWGVPDLATVPAARDAVAALYHLTKTLDPTRLVIGNDGWESSATDVIGMHDYDGDPKHLRVRYGPEVKPQEVVDRRWTGGRILTLDGYPHRGQPICLTEFGGIAYLDPERHREGDEWGYQSVRDLEEYATLVTSLLEVARTTAMFSGFCYTQFADTFQEANGLLYEDRTPKIPLHRIANAVRGDHPQTLPLIEK
ncbi:MAG TPA: glycoside hydrolase family 2 TIM barrel-domain containing protein [Steroidobacteraceae bacterium]|nr:glycoside hydrolase family 2 TIM barrel-domain containing protein [Steroidobacteraceae bacterium]